MKPPTCLRFSATVPATTAATNVTDASAIAPDANFLLSGLKLYTELFLKGNINNMADKDTIDTTPAHNAYTPGILAQDSGSTDSNYS